MSKQIGLEGIEAAKCMAALSPETQKRFDDCMMLDWTGPEQVTQAFRAIGVAIGSSRHPISAKSKKEIFAFAEQLLKHSSSATSNPVATCMLEQVWTAAQTSGFDFSEIDPYLGSEARRYLVAWDDFNKTKTQGLTRK